MSRIVVAGDVMRDVVATLAAPIAHGSDTPAAIAERGGGAGANVAAWLARAGAAVTLIGRVGDDPAGRAAADALRAEGVDLRLSVDPERPTGTCLVLVEPGGERTMLPDPGANAALVAEPLPPDATHLHVAGYALLRPGSRAAARALIAAARDAGATVSVDPSSAAPLARRAAVPRLGRGRRPAAAEPRRGGGADRRRRAGGRRAGAVRGGRRGRRHARRRTARSGATATRSCTCPAFPVPRRGQHRRGRRLRGRPAGRARGGRRAGGRAPRRLRAGLPRGRAGRR